MFRRFVVGVVMIGLLMLPGQQALAQVSTDVSGSIPLVASTVSSSGITSSAATITWITNGDSSSQVFYDRSSKADVSGYASSTALDSTLVSSHNVAMSGLTASTTYYFRVKSVTGDGLLTGVSDEGRFTTTASGGGGGGGFGGVGGGGGGGGGGASGPGATNITIFTNSDGLFNLPAVARSDDGLAQLSFSKGTLAQSNGGPLKSVNIKPAEPTPPPPENTRFVTLAYDFGPDSATFKPGATVSLFYDVTQLPAGFAEGKLVLVLWDIGGGKWVEVQGATVNTAQHSVTSTMNRSGRYALIARILPASFAIQGLAASPARANLGEKVTVTATVVNSGDLPGSYTVTLIVGGKQEATQDISLAGGSQQLVSFIFSPQTPGAITIQVNGASAEVDVFAPVKGASAIFGIKSLGFSPELVRVGDKAVIIVSVENSGGAAGTYEVIVSIGETTVDTRKVNLAPKSIDTLEIPLPSDVAGSYTVDVNGVRAGFTVNALPEANLPGQVNWYLIGVFIFAFTAAGSFVFFHLRSRPAFVPPVPPRVFG